MGGEPGAKRATAYKGGSGGLAHRFRPQRLEITHFVTISVMFFVVFHAFHHLFTPPKTASFPTGPASLFGGSSGVSSHYHDVYCTY